jgi:drug/metabolite transporter (DMT)-like permease
MPGFLVILGAGLWATDTLFRHPLVQQISPLTIVFMEHVFACSIAGIFLLVHLIRTRSLGIRQRLFLPSSEMSSAAFIGISGSALATILFTTSFQYVNPSVAILLQKIQPLVVITLSVVYLNEKLTRRFWAWCALALLAAFFVSFPGGLHFNELKTDFLDGNSTNARGVLYALFAAFLWGVSTVVGKKVLLSVESQVLTFWRFFFGLLTLLVLVRMSRQSSLELPFIYSDATVLKSLFLMALIPGFLGVMFYYRGLTRVPASIATILELAFPLSAMWVNARYLNLHLENVQVLAAFVLMAAMVGVSRSRA